MSTSVAETDPRHWFHNPSARDWRCSAPPTDAVTFHRRLPGYLPTPLADQPALASELRVGRVLIKDEGARFDLRAFKFLGASWAAYRAVAQRGDYHGQVTPAGLAHHLEASNSPLSLVAATDGNHGRAVARMGRILGLPTRIYVPSIVPPEVIERITSEFGQVTVVSANYDATVELARADADNDPHALLIQDTAWAGYTTIPSWIVEGYETLFTEVDTQLAELGLTGPDLIAVPVGVGSLAQAAVAHLRSRGSQCIAMSVEPTGAACVLDSLRVGGITTVDTGFTIMNGLNCGTPSLLAWPFLESGLDAAVAVSDEQTAAAVSDLANLGLISGPSGAACLSGARAALLGNGSESRRAMLGMGPDALVICISTEGFAPEP
jgi:diaminopropionate ammonia-lyase